jgi:hypothetical protein
MARIANSLGTLRSQLDAAFPDRSKASDGWIGDTRHQAEGDYKVSQHNPMPNGVVCALDVTHDPAHGVDIARLMEELDASNDPRIFYLIANRQIDNSDDSRTAYSGVDPHVNHLHISVRWQDPGLYDDGRAWSIPMLGGGAPAPAAASGFTGPDLTGSGAGLRGDKGNNGPRVLALQAWLNHNYGAYSKLVIDGYWGDKTTAVLREFGHRSGIPSADGLNIGPKLAAALTKAGLGL